MVSVSLSLCCKSASSSSAIELSSAPGLCGGDILILFSSLSYLFLGPSEEEGAVSATISGQLLDTSPIRLLLLSSNVHSGFGGSIVPGAAWDNAYV